MGNGLNGHAKIFIGTRVRLPCTIYDVRYDLLIMYALRRFFRIINVCRYFSRSIIMMTAVSRFLIRINDDISQ